MQYQYNKITNLRLAAARLDGVVLRPGETFSYWRLIGRPSRRKGYLDGIVLFCGTFRPGVGGGLCQMSNLIFWMTLHTPLTYFPTAAAPSLSEAARPAFIPTAT